MKCRNCGAEVGLLDKICPYCGSDNIESAGHRAKLDTYKKKSKETVEKADRKFNSNKPLIAGSIILVFLITGVITMSFLEDKTEYMDLDIAHSETLRNVESFKGILNGYLEAGDYISFHDFFEGHHIYETDPEYEEYKLLFTLSGEYRYAMNSMEQLLMYGEGYTSDKESDIRMCRLYISSFYTRYGFAEDDLEEYKYRGYAEDMKHKLDTAMKVYFGLDDKGLADYLASSENEQALFIEEVVLGE